MNPVEYFTEEEMHNVYLTYREGLYGYLVSRLRHPQDAEDLFSKTFLNFIRYTNKNSVQRDSIKAFLYRIATNLMKDFYRKRKPVTFTALDPQTEGIEYFMVPPSGLPGLIPEHRALDAREVLRKVHHQVDALPPEQQEAFLLRFREGFTFKEIASIQDISLGTALSRVRYAVQKIREALAPWLEEVL